MNKKYDKVSRFTCDKRKKKPFFIARDDSHLIRLEIRKEDTFEIGPYCAMDLAINYALINLGFEGSFTIREKDGVIEIIAESL